jgi:hypothetical protein
LLLREEAANEILKAWVTGGRNFRRLIDRVKIELLKSLRESRSGPVEKKFGFLEELS